MGSEEVTPRSLHFVRKIARLLVQYIFCAQKKVFFSFSFSFLLIILMKNVLFAIVPKQTIFFQCLSMCHGILFHSFASIFHILTGHTQIHRLRRDLVALLRIRLHLLSCQLCPLILSELVENKRFKQIKEEGGGGSTTKRTQSTP